MMEAEHAQLAVNIREAAAICGLSRSTLYLALRDGRLKCFRVGGRVLFSPRHLEAFLNAHESGDAKVAVAGA